MTPSSIVSLLSNSPIRPAVNGADRQTLDRIFHNPIVHNLAWDEVVALGQAIGDVEERYDNNLRFTIGRQTFQARKPHTHHLTAPEVMDLRHFLAACGVKPDSHAGDGEG